MCILSFKDNYQPGTTRLKPSLSSIDRYLKVWHHYGAPSLLVATGCLCLCAIYDEDGSAGTALGERAIMGPLMGSRDQILTFDWCSCHLGDDAHGLGRRPRIVRERREQNTIDERTLAADR